MSDLTDFLLARIAEDEGRLVHDSDCDCFKAYGYLSERGDCDCDAQKRLLAECIAKRHIIELHEDNASSAGMFASADEEASVATIRFLALPYADHPDYREEWKP